MQDSDSLINSLKDADVNVKRSAVDKLARLGNAQAINALVTLLDDETIIGYDDDGYAETVSGLSMNALAKIGLPAITTLIPLLEDSRTIVRSNAATVLGAIGRSRAVEPLIGKLQDQESRVRQSAAYSLGNIGDWQAVEPLVAILRDPDKGVRCATVQALEKLRDPDSIPALERAAQMENDAEMIAQIRFAIAQIRKYWTR